MKIINHEMIKNIKILSRDCYDWVDYIVKNFDEFVLPTKTRVPLAGTDYFNIMPCVLPNQNIMGVKVVTRNDRRYELDGLHLDAQIYLYSRDTEELLAVMDGNLITTMRTATIAVHSLLNVTNDFQTIAMVGLGNIGTAIGDILFDLCRDKKLTIKLYKYKEQEIRFARRFEEYTNITFVYCNTYESLMRDSDVVMSSVSYIENDFCDEREYKKGCVVIPVHMRGFMECDKSFDHIITSDLKSIEKFKYYSDFKKLSLLNDVMKGKIKARENENDRVLIYNLGIALYDIFFANEIFKRIDGNVTNIDISPTERCYV